MTDLFHVSERAQIEVFEPRLPRTATPNVTAPVVWAVDLAHLPHYLLPRDCPRVAFRATPETSSGDQAAFLGPGGARHVVAIEASWFETATHSTLWIYGFAPAGFACVDAIAGYYVSRTAATPICCRAVDNPLAELLSLGAELRVLPSLVALAAAVAQSTLAFSCIRMRNAGRGPINPDG